MQSGIGDPLEIIEEVLEKGSWTPELEKALYDAIEPIAARTFKNGMEKRNWAVENAQEFATELWMKLRYRGTIGTVYSNYLKRVAEGSTDEDSAEDRTNFFNSYITKMAKNMAKDLYRKKNELTLMKTLNDKEASEEEVLDFIKYHRDHDTSAEDSVSIREMIEVLDSLGPEYALTIWLKFLVRSMPLPLRYYEDLVETSDLLPEDVVDILDAEVEYLDDETNRSFACRSAVLAELLGVGHSTVDQRVRRVLPKLRHLFEALDIQGGEIR